ncbi:MAG: hypothetical protein Q9195_008927 [Heterodermia aff. obscurata]
MQRRTDIAGYCATIGAKEAKPLEWDLLAEAVNERSPGQVPISPVECQEIISHYMHNYGYPNYETEVDLYPPLRDPWASEERQDSQKSSTKAGGEIDQIDDGNPWEEDTPDIQMPRPAHLSPRKPSSDGFEQKAAERLVATRISSPRKDGK